MEIPSTTGGLTTGKYYYRMNQEKNKAAVKRYRNENREVIGAWNRRYYFKHRTSKMPYKYRVYITRGKREYWKRKKVQDFNPFQYIDGERFERNMRDCDLYFQLITGKIAVDTYKSILKSNYDNPRLVNNDGIN